MSRRRFRSTCPPLLAMLLAVPAASADLERDFSAPPASLRPLVRWWWNGARVTEAELVRELDLMKAAGIGGVEINTIAMPPEVPSESLLGTPALRWLGPEWNRAVRAAAAAARERGMTADIIVGSGWPFGGRFLGRGEQTQRVRLVKTSVTGPARLASNVGTLARERRPGRDEVEVPARALFVRLSHDGAAAFEPGIELSARVRADGALVVDVPAGPHTLRCGFLEEGFTHVKLGAPGADGPVLNHFDGRAVRRYLDHMSDALAPALDGRLGTWLRAAFVDSLELEHANWTADLPHEFARRRGYALEPYLPFVLDYEGFQEETPRADVVRRARYDFHRTLVELFHERFVATFAGWCRANGLLSRAQAYGRETHPLDGGLLVDLAEGESWLWSDHDRILVSPTVVNKYVASAAHLAGRRRVSFEAMTNAVPAFREMPADFKQATDMSLLAGVLQPVLHGFNYSPPEAGFPGWVRFGSYFSERATWWPHFRRFTDYAARLTAVLSQSDAQAEIALLGPRADEWSRHHLLYQPFPEVALPWYHYDLWQAFASLGFGTDFVSENVVQKAAVSGGRLAFGPQSYRALVVMEAASLEVDTTRAIEAFAHAGGSVIFVGQAPGRAPGLAHAEANDQAVRQAVAAALAQDPGRVAVVPAPVLPPIEKHDWTRSRLPDDARRTLLHWAATTAARFGLAPDVRISAPHIDVGQIHHRAAEREIFFFANTSLREEAAFVADFPTDGRTPWRWDPETGERAPYAHRGAPGTLAVHLSPLESLLLVFEPDAPSAHAPPLFEPRRATAAVEWHTLTSEWRLTFRHIDGQRTFERRVAQLSDLSLSADAEVASFAGDVTCRTTVTLERAGFDVLDLGPVNGVTAVRLNGRPLGVRWWGRHRYDVSGALRPGENELEVVVTTTVANYVKSLRNNATAQRWASWFPPIPSGLVGPVQLIKSR